MTAIRVIDDHEDLENVGAITHQQLDNYIDHTRWVLGPGSNPVPSSALTIVEGDGISITELGNQLVVTNTSLFKGNMSGVIWRLMEVPFGIIDGNNCEFTLGFAPQPANSLMLFVNGVLQSAGFDDDYVLSGNTITFIKPPIAGSKISAAYSYSSIMGVVWSFMETPSGVVNDVNINFTLNSSPYPSHNLMLYINGVLQVPGSEFDFVLSDNIITLASPPLLGSKVVATYPYLVEGTRIAWMERPIGDIDSINMVFDLTYTPNPSATLMFFVNGILQRQNDDYILSGNSVMLFDAPPVGSNLVAHYQY